MNLSDSLCRKLKHRRPLRTANGIEDDADAYRSDKDWRDEGAAGPWFTGDGQYSFPASDEVYSAYFQNRG